MDLSMKVILALLLVVNKQLPIVLSEEVESTCQTGSSQSPIAVDLSLTNYVSYPTFYFSEDYAQPTKFQVLKEAGHSIVITPNLVESQTLTVSGGCLSGVFTFRSVHLHWPRSEHTFLKYDYIAEAHFIHQNAETNETAVFAFFFTLGEQSSEVKQKKSSSWDRLCQSENNTSVTIEGGLASMMAGHKNRFVHYSGSLTTSPCTEDVLWVLVASAIQLQDTSLSRIQSEVISSNYRAIQPLNGRSVWRSFLSTSWDI